MLILSQTWNSCANDKAAQTSCGIVCNFMITVSWGVSTTPITAPNAQLQNCLQRVRYKCGWVRGYRASEKERLRVSEEQSE